MIRRPPRSTLFPTRRSSDLFKPFVPHDSPEPEFTLKAVLAGLVMAALFGAANAYLGMKAGQTEVDRKSTRLNSSHGYISYAVFCLKKKKKNHKLIFAHKMKVITGDDRPDLERSRNG